MKMRPQSKLPVLGEYQVRFVVGEGHFVCEFPTLFLLAADTRFLPTTSAPKSKKSRIVCVWNRFPLQNQSLTLTDRTRPKLLTKCPQTAAATQHTQVDNTTG